MIVLYILGYILGALLTFFFILYKNDIKNMQELECEFNSNPEICAALVWFLYLPSYIVVKLLIVISKRLLNSYFSLVSKPKNESYYVLGESENYRELPKKIKV